jgi:putative transposase
MLIVIMHYKYEYRRRLPHYQPDAKIFFITFCTYQRWTLPERARRIVLDACLRGDSILFDLLAVVVMPDHTHLALVPRCQSDRTVSIAEIMQAIKGTSAHKINREFGRRGPVWQQESFDRALRQEQQVDQKIDYMLGNPVRAGLVRNPMDYPCFGARRKAGKRSDFRQGRAERGQCGCGEHATRFTPRRARTPVAPRTKEQRAPSRRPSLYRSD